MLASLEHVFELFKKYKIDFKLNIKAFLIIISILVTVVALKHINNKRVILYSWEVNDNFAFLENSKNVYVAALTFHLIFETSDKIRVLPRVNGLYVPKGVKVIPVIRLDNASNISVDNMNQSLNIIISECNSSEAKECQIDFDYKESEYTRYKSFISTVRERVNKDIKITATGLASNCYSGSGSDNLEVDEVVPLFIDLGDGGNHYIISSDKCASSIGFATYQNLPDQKLLRGKDIYIFNNMPWTKDQFLQYLDIAN